MRVALVLTETTHRRDTELGRRTERTARLLAARGHQAVVLCKRWWDNDRSQFELDDITFRAVGNDGEGDGRFATRLPTAIRDVDPDVVHVAHTTSRVVLGAKAGAVLARVPLVVDWYGTEDPILGADLLSEAGRRGRRAGARTPEAVVVPSETVRTRVRELGADDHAVTVIPDSVDFDAIRGASPVEVADVVYARRLDDDANLESVLLALAELRDRDWSAAVIGDGPRRASYERQAKDLRIDDRVTFAGEQPLEKRIRAYRGAHVFVQTSYREAFPTELLWALACGCVGVVEYHAESSAHELVEHCDRGFRTTSEQELTDAIREASSLPRETINEEFEAYDDDAVLDQYVRVYEDAAEKVSIAPLVAAGGAVVALLLILVALFVFL